MKVNKKTSSVILIPGDQSFDSIQVNQSKLLIGSAENCDFTMNHSSISHYHALIECDSDGMMIIMDLNSVSGVFVNGNRVTSISPLSLDDTLTIGEIHFNVLTNSEDIEFEQYDTNIKRATEQNVYVPKAVSENEVLIDDEYCDIIFDESHFRPLSDLALKNLTIGEYIAPIELEESFDLEKTDIRRCIQISTLTTGTILDQYYLPLNIKEINVSNIPKSKNLLIETLENEEESLFSITNGQIQFNELEGFQVSKKQLGIEDTTSVVIYSKGTYQIFIEIADVPSHLINIPQIHREKDFIKDSSKVFAGIMLPLLLLLFVNFEIPKPKKKLSIIYKKPTNSKIDGKKLASKNPTSKVKNTGQKSTKQPEKKVSRNKAGQKAKAKPKKAVKKVAKAQKAPAKKTKKAKAPVKAYQFKMASNVKSLFSNSKAVAVTKSRSPAAASSSAAVTGSLNTTVTGTASNKVGNLGSDLAGAQASMGARGLSSKSGRDTSYIQTKTVVLGSMDPELLRKILQRYLPQFRHCYQEELANNSEDIKGIVDLNFTISGSGKVSEINIKAKDKRFSRGGINCMGKVLSIIDFPKPKGGGRVAVRQPLSFFAEQENS